MNQSMISQPLQHLDKLISSTEFSPLVAAASIDFRLNISPNKLAESFLNQLYGENDRFGVDSSPIKSTAGSGVRLPCLNELPANCTSMVRTDTLVKFRGMVQATLEPELYHKSAGLFRDRCPTGSESMLTDAQVSAAGGWSNLLGERQRCLCVPVPHETAWLKSELSQRDRIEEAELVGLYATMSVGGDDKLEQKESNEKPSEAKKARLGQGGDAFCWNGDSVELLIYADECNLRVHDLVETIAILSVGPMQSDNNSDDVADNASDSDPCPPSPSVFRLHSLTHRKLASQVLGAFTPVNLPIEKLANDLDNNAEQIQDVDDDEELDKDDPQWAFLRNALLGVLTEALLGDNLAAEYLLLHLISAVYLRGLTDCSMPDDDPEAGLLAVGKLSLNLSCCQAQLARHIGRLLELLVPRLCRLPLSLGCLNAGQLTPQLDCNSCRLKPGLLQMPSHTQLVLDETAMETGRLSENGLANLKALGRLVSRQAVEFDLQMYRKDFAADLRVLVVSEGKSVLPCDLLLPLEAKNFISQSATESDFNRLLDKVTLDKPFLREIRRYLAGVTQLAVDTQAYSIRANQQAWIEADFVSRRQAARAKSAKHGDDFSTEVDDDGSTANDLALRLVLCRLLTLSLGRRRPTRSLWDRVARMEAERKRRQLRACKNSPA